MAPAFPTGKDYDMKILVACEYSGTVRDAFRKQGHDAWSCDLLPTDADPTYHIQGDVFKVLDQGWDMMIAHPPCTYLSNSGVCWLHKDPKRWELMKEGAEFFKHLLNSNIPKIAVENPIQHKYAREIIGKTYTQIIQPWMFGHTERKATCLWLKGLEPLKPTNNVYEEMLKLPKNQQQRLHYLPPSEDRWKLRSKTFQGIAEAMAEQWSN
ncbi:MAG TPA: DNA cytosine methyltransferase [Thermoclostridium sp.]|nr:DNA cytosine methyltransferase [Thermoclostridium sp.]